MIDLNKITEKQLEEIYVVGELLNIKKEIKKVQEIETLFGTTSTRNEIKSLMNLKELLTWDIISVEHQLI